jgi:CubicO group peptidase (beta-lactamase class C family)
MELGVPVDPGMVFEIGSVTKQITAAAILLLVEQGKIRLEEDFRTYLTDYPANGQTITVEHLLTHTSGIPSYTGMQEWAVRMREDFSLDQLIGLFKDKPLEFNPGESWAYNNSAYVLLGAVIEKVSGKSYERFVEEEIFAKLGMKDSRYAHPEELVPRRASGYGRGPEEGFKNAQYISMSHPFSAGALLSTVDDLAVWDRALYGESLLKKASIERMFTPVNLKSGQNTQYAYGWGVSTWEGKRLMEHSGGIPGFAAYVARVPEERMFVAILSNDEAADPDPGSLALRIVSYALGKPQEARASVALDAKTLDEYLGVYRFDGAITRTVTREGSTLFSQRSGGEKAELLALGQDRFLFKESNGRLDFQRDAQGRVTGAVFAPRAGLSATGVRTEEKPPAERQAVKVDPAIYDAYVGDYELSPNFSIKVTRQGDSLFGQATGQPAFEMFPESETRFFLKVVDAQVTFEKGADGKVTGLVLHQGGRDVPGRRVR